MKLRSFFYGLLAIVVLLLLVGASSFYWIAAQSPLSLLKGGQDKVPAAAMFVPRQAPAMVSLLVKPDQLAAFRQVVVPPSQRQQARTEVAQLKQSLLANTGLDYERDIQPWVGDEVTLAITTLDIDRDRSNGKQPGYLLAIATKDPEQSREFLQLFWQKQAIAGTDLTFEQYKGVKLIYAETPELPAAKPTKSKTAKREASDRFASDSLLSTSSWASAVVGNQFVLFANDPKVLRDAITNVQAPDLNLIGARFYTNALAVLNQPRVGLAFVNVPGLANWLEGEAVVARKGGKRVKEADQADTTLTPASGKYQTLAIALELDRQGLLANTALQTADGKDPTVIPGGNQPVAALQYLPASSAIAASGTHLDQQWGQLSATLQGYEAIAQWVNQPLQELQTRWQLDLPQDMFRWVTGDYALGLLPPSAEIQRQNGVERQRRNASSLAKDPILATANDWIFVAERSAPEATAAIAHLDDLAKQQGYSIGTLQLGDQPVSAWTRLSTGGQTAKTLQAEVQGVHAAVGDYEIFATSVVAMSTALDALQDSLAQATSFQQAIAPLQQPNNGYLYLDWDASRELLEQQLPVLKVVQLAAKPFFSHLRSLTLSSYGSQDGVQRGGIFVQLR